MISGVTDRYVITVGRFLNTGADDEHVFAEFLETAEKYDPSGYQKIHQHLLKSLSAGELSYNMAYDSELMNYIVAYAAHADERPMLAYAQVFAEALAALAVKDPDACYTALTGSSSDAKRQSFMGALGADSKRKLSYALLRAATNGARNDLPTPSAQDVAAPIGKLWSRMHEKYPQEAAALAHPQPDNHAAYCQYFADLTTEITLLPADTGMPIMRFLMASDTEGSRSNGGSGSTAPPAAWMLKAHPDK